MADGSSDGVESATLEGAAADWLADRADELDTSSDQLLQRIVAAYRAAEAGDAPSDVATSDDLQSLRDDLEGDVAAVDDEFTEKLQDVRERVIQVKREADGKAPADHDHPELDERTREAVAAVEDVQAEVADVAARVERVSDRLDAGFDNFEQVLTYLRDETDDLHGKVTALATAVLSMRESVGAVAAANARRERTDRLKRRANRENVRVADCEACGSETTVSLLTSPECPSCGAAFEDVEANQGWFGTHTLLTGSAPALTAGDQPEEDEVEDWLGADAETLEEMVADEAGDDGPDVVDPGEVASPDADGGHGAEAEPAESGARSDHEAAAVSGEATGDDASESRATDDSSAVAPDDEKSFDAESLAVDDDVLSDEDFGEADVAADVLDDERDAAEEGERDD